MVNIARTTPTITPMMNHSIIVLLHGQGWFFSHGSRIFLSAQKREEFIPVSPYGAGWVSGQGGGGTPSKRENGGATRGRRDRYLINERKKDSADLAKSSFFNGGPSQNCTGD